MQIYRNQEHREILLKVESRVVVWENLLQNTVEEQRKDFAVNGDGVRAIVSGSPAHKNTDDCKSETHQFSVHIRLTSGVAVSPTAARP